MSYGAVAAPAAGGRINGFSRPFTDKQILFWLSNTGSVVYFLVLAMNFYGADSEVRPRRPARLRASPLAKNNNNIHKHRHHHQQQQQRFATGTVGPCWFIPRSRRDAHGHRHARLLLLAVHRVRCHRAAPRPAAPRRQYQHRHRHRHRRRRAAHFDPPPAHCTSRPRRPAPAAGATTRSTRRASAPCFRTASDGPTRSGAGSTRRNWRVWTTSACG